MLSKKDIETIKELSQEYALTDEQIAKRLKCSRATVNRARKKHQIPIRNIQNKSDKAYICVVCKSKIFIKRCESRKLVCDNCLAEIKNN